MEMGSCCYCWLATSYWGFVGARGPANEETGLTGGVAVGVQEGAGAAALLGPAAGPAGSSRTRVHSSDWVTPSHKGIRGAARACRARRRLADCRNRCNLSVWMLTLERSGACFKWLLEPLGGALAAGMLGLGGRGDHFHSKRVAFRSRSEYTQVPNATMKIVEDKGGAIALMIVALLFLGTWPALLNLLERRGRNPVHTYLDYSITNFLVAVIIALTLGQIGAPKPGEPNFTTQLSQVLTTLFACQIDQEHQYGCG
ncbi:TPA: hypothetical protein ACH3X1_010239 [Trebouxia sp. C0004]